MTISLFPAALAVVFLIGLVAGVYGVLLWGKLSRMEGKMDNLRQNCDRHQEDSNTRFLPRLEHEVEHQGLWEALHHHEHDFQGRFRQ